MKRVFGLAMVVVAAVILTACGTTVVPELTKEAELEIQIITSESDSSPIDFLEIRNSEGELVFSERGLMNRVHRFYLTRGEAYTISARMSFARSDIATGEISYERQITLVSDEQRAVLDLSELLSVREDYGSTNDTPVVLLGFPSKVYDDLELVTGRFESSGFTPLLEIVGNVFAHENILTDVSFAENDVARISFVRNPHRNKDDVFGDITRSHFTLNFDSSVYYCHYYQSVRLGSFEFLWESESSHVTQKLDLYKACKG